MGVQPKIGIGYRDQLRGWLATPSPLIECLEITAEHFFDREEDCLARLADQHPLYVHGLGLSLGTPGALDKSILNSFTRVSKIARACWVSDHISFTRAGGTDLGHLNPVPRTREMLSLLADHVLEVGDRCGTTVLMENITAQFDPGGELEEPDFLNQLCERSGCRLLLDVTNLFINARNHRFTALAWLHAIHPDFIVQLHVVGYAERNGWLHDTHGAPMQSDLLDLIGEVLAYAPVASIILERDERLDETVAIEVELEKLHDLLPKTAHGHQSVSR
jgi:uncharacterized protein (UPF0276 family)